MTDIKEYTRPIISFLKKLQGDDLYITGQCLLKPIPFDTAFIHSHNSLRPIFLLKPNGTSEHLIFIPDGKVKDLGGEKHIGKHNPLSIQFFNTVPLMYILRVSDLSQERVSEILRSPYEIKDGICNTYPETSELRKEISDKGFIQPCVIRANFTATFHHENSPAGMFTLTIKD